MASYPYWDYKTQSWRKMKVPSGKGRGLDIFDPRGSYRFGEWVKRNFIRKASKIKGRTDLCKRTQALARYFASDEWGSYRFDEAVKRQFIERPARRERKVTAQQVRAEVQKIGTAKTFREVKVRTGKALRLLDECLPQVFVCRVRIQRRKTRPKHGR